MAEAPACAGCLKWELFKEKCWFFWENKKFCPNKIESNEGFEESRQYTGF